MKKKWRKRTDSWCRRRAQPKKETMDMFSENLQDKRLSKLLLPSNASGSGDLAEFAET